MLISSSDMKRQGRTAFINQNVDLCSTFPTIGGIAARSHATQGCGDCFAVNCLPLPTDSLFAGIETDHGLQDLLPDTCLLPVLEAFMQDTAGNTKPVAVYCFPLTTGPQDVPDACDHSPVVCTGPARALFPGVFGQVFLDTPPQRARNMEEIDISRFCDTLVFDDAPRWMMLLP